MLSWHQGGTGPACTCLILKHFVLGHEKQRVLYRTREANQPMGKCSYRKKASNCPKIGLKLSYKPLAQSRGKSVCLSSFRASQHPALNVTSTQRNRSDHNAQKIPPFAISSSSSDTSSSSSLSSEPTSQISMVQDQTLLDIASITRLAPGESPNPQPFEQRNENLAISCSSPLGARTIPASCPASPRLSLTPSSAKPQQYSDSSPVSPGINATSFYTFCPHTAQNVQASASNRTLTPTTKSTRPPATTTPEDSSQSPGYSKTGLKNTGKGFESDLEDPDHERYVSRPYTCLSPQMTQLGIGSLRAPHKKI